MSAEGDYLGGAIAPGISIASDALFQRAAKLPRVDLQSSLPAAVGRKHSALASVRIVYLGTWGWWKEWSRAFAPNSGPQMKVVANRRVG